MREFFHYFFGAGDEIEFKYFSLAHILPIVLAVIIIYLIFRYRDRLRTSKWHLHILLKCTRPCVSGKRREARVGLLAPVVRSIPHRYGRFPGSKLWLQAIYGRARRYCASANRHNLPGGGRSPALEPEKNYRRFVRYLHIFPEKDRS